MRPINSLGTILPSQDTHPHEVKCDYKKNVPHCKLLVGTIQAEKERKSKCQSESNSWNLLCNLVNIYPHQREDFLLQPSDVLILNILILCYVSEMQTQALIFLLIELHYTKKTLHPS